MEEIVFEFDGRRFTDLASFIDEFNRAFAAELGMAWRGNFDSFNDFLSWPSHSHPDAHILLRWKDADLSRERLGHAEMARWLEERSRNCHPSNIPMMRARLDAARRGEGPTLFDFITEIISENAVYIELRLVPDTGFAG